MFFYTIFTYLLSPQNTEKSILQKPVMNGMTDVTSVIANMVVL